MRKIIGIIGTIGAGKDFAAEYIAKKFGLPILQISQPVRDIAKEKNIEPTRLNLVELGSRIAEEKGDDYLVKFLLQTNNVDAIITGMRQLGQIECLKKEVNLTLIAIDADPVIRFERTKTRGKAGEASNVEEFIEWERKENSAPHVQRLFECLKLADYKIENNGTREELYKKIDRILVKRMS